ncbi:ATP-binding cassette domain-containing protein [Bacillus sp. B15-48]|uniref:methionine ABC transporter ATP-binding protein n=1 Tax=Bacillus sp. B15-48 TaxID=1548601 RepID=UPI00193FD9A8|nr:ATP-binding cassette domain-containing protein [Bacillus sp. B15-48]MBM4761002.1 ATP-binding cassette domain-containing protein [Bacillus sp. B15-48]
MIEMKNIYKTFERKGITTEALKGINLKVEKGDIFGVIGYSGAGKSTLIRLVNYLEKPTKGHVVVNGKSLDQLNVKELRTMKKNIGMIFQHFNLLESKTIYQNVAMPLVLSKVNKAEIRERVMELLEFVGLSEKADNYPNELSGGQKQRIGIARALASNPSILLCDEATSALDPQTTQSILNLLKRVNQEYGITIMIITHEMGVIQEICNKVAVMEMGEIIEQGSVLEVFGQPKHPSTQYFVQTVIRNRITPSVENKLPVSTDSKRVKIELVGESVSTPILNHLIKNYEIEVNVLFANTTEIQETTLVIMYLDLKGRGEQVQAALEYLQKHSLFVEEVAK